MGKLDLTHTLRHVAEQICRALLVIPYVRAGSVAATFLIAATLSYSGIFLIVGFIGRRGFSLGVILCIFELFFLSLLFLEDEPYIPRTNLFVIADSLFSPTFTYNSSKAPDLLFSLGYVAFMGIIWFILGAYYIKRRQFE